MRIPLTKLHLPERYCIALVFLFFVTTIYAQKQKADSLDNLLAAEKADTNKVLFMWQLADAVSMYQPDTALKTAQQALFLARRIRYKEGESRSLGIIAEIFRKIGNYPRALEFNIKKLELEDNRNNPYNLASVLMNIGIVYVFQEEYQEGLQYYSRADSIITAYNIEPFKYNIALNIGDVYNRLNVTDSAYAYFNKSLDIANKLKDGDYIGTSMTGLAHTYVKQGNYPFALLHYQTAIPYLKAAHDDDIFCEATLGLACLFQKLNKNDSAVYYALLSVNTAKKAGFLAHELEAAEMLTNHYKDVNRIDSAFMYMNYVRNLNDTINSRGKIREIQIISSNEQLRQAEIEENRQIALRERSQQLQLLFIAMFIIFLFLVTVILSRIRISVRVVRILGIVSLLMFFEYLTLLLHPYVKEITHHTPIFEIIIFVAMAAVLIPAHHRIEHWMIAKLTRGKHETRGMKFKLKTISIKVKAPSDK
ncbi:MAG: tetratricopeptide repeat protein [Chitinophagaceae bacterium]|nr:tetratricopeptide repeat protein [Chitinophagaceae bacterium]